MVVRLRNRSGLEKLSVDVGALYAGENLTRRGIPKLL